MIRVFSIIFIFSLVLSGATFVIFADIKIILEERKVRLLEIHDAVTISKGSVVRTLYEHLCMRKPRSRSAQCCPKTTMMMRRCGALFGTLQKDKTFREYLAGLNKSFYKKDIERLEQLRNECITLEKDYIIGYYQKAGVSLVTCYVKSLWECQ